MKKKHIVHLTGDLAGLKELTRCGIRNGNVHIVGPAKIHQVSCPRCGEWYNDMRLRLTATGIHALEVGIDEKAYTDAVAALLRFRSELLAERSVMEWPRNGMRLNMPLMLGAASASAPKVNRRGS